MEFAGSLNKIEKEQEKRRKLAKQKLDNEKLLKQKQIEIEERRQKEAEIKALQAAKEEERKRIMDDIEQKLTGGVKFEMSAIPLLLENGEDDRIILPQSALEELNNKNAMLLGPLMFMVRSSQGSHITHCGVKEFTAEEGTVKLPQKVIDSLYLSNPEEFTSVTIKYVKLNKSKFIRFQPVSNLFTRVGPVKDVLTANLVHHATITEGDRVKVWYRGVPHELVVKQLMSVDDEHDEAGDGDGDGGMELKEGVERDEDVHDNMEVVGDDGNVVDGGHVSRPRACTLIDTCVEVELDVSMEYEAQAHTQAQAQEPAQQGKQSQYNPPRVVGVSHIASHASSSVVHPSSSSSSKGGSGSIAPPPPAPLSAFSSASDTSTVSPMLAMPPSQQALLLEIVGEEPGQDVPSDQIVVCRVRMPSGGVLTRKLNRTDSHGFKKLFAFVKINMNMNMDSSQLEQGKVIQLMTRQPARKFMESDTGLGSMVDSNINTLQEQFIVSYVAMS